MPELNDRATSYETSIFFNCPFDPEYQPIFHALIFATYDCGYRPYCALEIDDGGQVRVEKIVKMIKSCRLGVHDISRTELDTETICRGSICPSSLASLSARPDSA
jgi:hypothetical protein